MERIFRVTKTKTNRQVVLGDPEDLDPKVKVGVTIVIQDSLVGPPLNRTVKFLEQSRRRVRRKWRIRIVLGLPCLGIIIQPVVTLLQEVGICCRIRIIHQGSSRVVVIVKLVIVRRTVFVPRANREAQEGANPVKLVSNPSRCFQ